MTLALEHEQDVFSMLAGDCGDQGWHISFRMAPGIRTKGVDSRAMLHALAEMGVCRVIGRNEPSSALFGATLHPVGWDMVLVGNTTRAEIEDVFGGMPDAMELTIEQIH